MLVGNKFDCALHYHVGKRVISFDQLISWVKLGQPNPEMEKAADAADMSVLFFSAGANF